MNKTLQTTLLFFAVTGFVAPLSANVSQGMFSAGAGVSFDSIDMDLRNLNIEDEVFTFNADFDYFITDNTAARLTVGYVFSEVTATDGGQGVGEDDLEGLLLEGGFDYYLMTEGAFLPFVGGMVTVTRYEFSIDGDPDEDIVTVGVRAGALFPVSDMFAVRLQGQFKTGEGMDSIGVTLGGSVFF